MVKLAKSLKSQWPELSLDEIKPNHFDVVFIGSDEVFNCCQKTTWGYTSQLYGHIPQADRIVSYAGDVYKRQADGGLLGYPATQLLERQLSIDLCRGVRFRRLVFLQGVGPKGHTVI